MNKAILLTGLSQQLQRVHAAKTQCALITLLTNNSKPQDFVACRVLCDSLYIKNASLAVKDCGLFYSEKPGVNSKVFTAKLRNNTINVHSSVL